MHTTYTGAYGPQFVHSRLEFVNALDVDGAFLSGWRELAYGCGFGRFASLLLSKGPAEQPDLVDAWALSIDHITNGGFKNKCWMVSELPENDLKPGIYNLTTAFSVFTHYLERCILDNLACLYWALRLRGRIYFTVRDEEFIKPARGRRSKARWSENELIVSGPPPLFPLPDGRGRHSENSNRRYPAVDLGSAAGTGSRIDVEVFDCHEFV